MAIWHHPRFSSGEHGDDPALSDSWNALYEHRASVVINGHDHDYERFALQDPSGRQDLEHGIRQFIVGTGGAELRPFETVRPNSEVRDNTSYGVLKLILRENSYDWQFVPAVGSFTDAGTGQCNR